MQKQDFELIAKILNDAMEAENRLIGDCKQLCFAVFVDQFEKAFKEKYEDFDWDWFESLVFSE